MRVRVTAMTVEVTEAAAKAAGDRATVGLAVRARHCGEARTAVDRARVKSGCDGADGSTSHQGQHDAARAFHEAALPSDQAVLRRSMLLKRLRSDKPNAVI
jgi:hypothetical protein